MIYFLDNQNACMIGAFMAPGSTELTSAEYLELLRVPVFERVAKLAEMRAPKTEEVPNG